MLDSENKSPFDDALSHPFIEREPVKKRWSWSLLASRKDVANPSGMNINYREYEAPVPISEIVLDPSNEKKEYLDEEMGGLIGTRFMLCEQKFVELDSAILRERHEHIGEIKSSLTQINEIQKDLAAAVEEQEADINRFSAMAIDSLEHASAGVSNLLAMQKDLAESSKKRKKALAAVAFFLFLVAVRWLRSSWYADNGIPQH